MRHVIKAACAALAIALCLLLLQNPNGDETMIRVSQSPVPEALHTSTPSAAVPTFMSPLSPPPPPARTIAKTFVVTKRAANLKPARSLHSPPPPNRVSHRWRNCQYEGLRLEPLVNGSEPGARSRYYGGGQFAGVRRLALPPAPAECTPTNVPLRARLLLS